MAANWRQRLDMVADGFDDDHHRHRENRAPCPPEPRPEQNAKEHDDYVHMLGFAEHQRREQPSLQRGNGQRSGRNFQRGNRLAELQQSNDQEAP
jgi:hypothetical protein